MRRRTLLKGALAAGGATLLPAPALASPRPLETPAIDGFSGKIVARHVPDAAPEIAIPAGQLFERVGVHFKVAPGAEPPTLELRTSADGTLWSEWRALRVDPFLTDELRGTFYVSPVAVPGSSRFAQYRVARGALASASFTFLDVSDLNAGPLARIARSFNAMLARARTSAYALAAPSPMVRILSRQDWGADESLMQWTPEYVPQQKVIVHHTVTNDGGSDVPKELRAIYYFHAVTRGWGDIGYHYIVDRSGTIWIGRQGGDHVVAGHALGWNDGTIGVAALGDYTSAQPSLALRGAIANLIALKLRQLGIAPLGSGPYLHHESAPDGTRVDVTTTVPNVLGHKDCTERVGKTGAATSCPGTLYDLLPTIRSDAQSAWQNGYQQLARIDPQLGPAGVAGQGINAIVLVTNAGLNPIPAGTVVNYRVLRLGQPVSQGTGTPLAQAIPVGATTSVQVQFLAPAAKGEYVVRWDLQTGGSWWSQVYLTPFRDTWFRAADWSAQWLSDTVPQSWRAGETRVVSATIKNDGGRIWNSAGTNPVRIAYYWISTTTGKRFDALTKQPLPRDVAPGETITVSIPLTAPQWPDSYTVTLDLYKENEFWFKDRGLRPDDSPTVVSVDWNARYSPAALPPLEAGQTVTVPVVLTNLGNGYFPAAGAFPVTLGYHWYSAGKTVVWDGARTKLPADLAPGSAVTVNAKVTAPSAGGSYELKFDLVQEGVGWFSDKGVVPPQVVATVAAPAVPVYGARYEPGVTALALQSGVAAIPFTVENTSNFTWPAAGANPVRLSYHWYDAKGSLVAWNGERTLLKTDLAPGQSQNLLAQVVFPAAQGAYVLRWDLVHEGVTWFSGKGVPTFDQSVTVGSRFYGGSVDVSAVPSQMPAGQTIEVPLRVQNMSSFDFDAYIDLSYHWYDALGRTVVWDGERTPLVGLRVNELRDLKAVVKVPTLEGRYTLKFDFVHEGVGWFSDRGMMLAPIAVNVLASSYGAQYSSSVSSVTSPPDALPTVPLTVKNTGSATWQPGKVNAAYRLIADSGRTFVYDGVRTILPRPVGPGESVTLQAAVRAPAYAGTWTIRFDMVDEGVTWFSDRGIRPLEVTLVVQ